MIWSQVDSAAADITSAALQHPAAFDSVRVKSPLPSGVAQVVRFLLTTVPSWIQIGGLIVAAIVGCVVLWMLFRRRRRIAEWFASRPGPVKAAIAVAGVVVLAGAATAGAVSWNYTQHANEFCGSCHVMDPAFEKMAGGETKHSKLSCHSCHQQSVFASARQVYVWISERPEEIGSHAVVPNARCEACHVTQDTAAWARIASTAGHRVHLQSDSASLKNVECVKCHGGELHHFETAKQTCGQTGCHAPKETSIRIAKMSGQTVRHCTSCHSFTTEVPALATQDSASRALVPGSSQCLGCHDMRKALPDFNVAKDPHGGKCGTCHNPHEQTSPRGALSSCATAGCHGNWKDEPFHSGPAHRKVAEKCQTCHIPHAAKVDASECAQCHERVRSAGKGSPPQPFDTTRALRRSDNIEAGAFRVAALSDVVTSRVHDVQFILGPPPPPEFRLSIRQPPPTAAIADSFSHTRHEKLACLVCHQTGSGLGLLTFERPRGCMICHHQAPSQSKCTSCHQTSEIAPAKTANAVVTVRGHAPRSRPVAFLHSTHAMKKCTDCHVTPVTMEPSAPKATCRDCHDDHHADNRACATCHSPADPKSAHTSLETSHRQCDACHTASTVSRLTPTRTFCSACHTGKATGHYPQKECTSCHFLTDPGSYKSELTSRR